MDVAMRTADHPPRERFEAWADLVSRALVPVEVTAADRATYEGEILVGQFDQVCVSSVTSTSCISRRTRRLISHSDPEAVQIMLVTEGSAGLSQNGTDGVLIPGDFAVHVTWRPFVVHALANDYPRVAGITALIPRRQIPLSVSTIEKLTAHTISSNGGAGCVVAGMLTSLIQMARVSPADQSRLSCALVDVVTVALNAFTGVDGTQQTETVEHAMRTAVRAYVQLHLADPNISPAMVARAHHLSTRSLHRLFQGRGSTVADMIRRGRLERCLRDLRDPALRHRRVQEIAARWCFYSPGHFNRHCRERTGMTPRQYRQRHLAAMAEVEITSGLD